MSDEKPLVELIKSLEESFEIILGIIKTIGNDKRFKILITLMTGEKTFDILKKETDLQKTALSNHLATLTNYLLIEKPDYGKYKITPDGRLFIRTIEAAYTKSDIWKKKQTEYIQKRKFSDSFVQSFFRRS